MKQLNNHNISLFSRNCSVGCSSDIWHYFTSLEPAYYGIASDFNLQLTPPIEYNGKSALCFINLIPQGRNISDNNRNQTFARLLTSLREPLFIEVYGDSQGFQLQCCIRYCDETILKQAIENTFTELRLISKTEDSFTTALPRFLNNEIHGYTFDLLSFIPNRPTLGVIPKVTENSGFWSYLLQTICMELEEEERILMQMAVVPCKHDWGMLSVETIRKAKLLVREDGWIPNNVKSMAAMLSTVSEKTVISKYFAVTLRYALIMKSSKLKEIRRKLQQGFALIGRPFHTVDRNYLRRYNLSNSVIRKAVTNRLFLFPGFPIPESEFINLLPFKADGVFTGIMKHVNSYTADQKNGDVHITSHVLGHTRFGNRKLTVSIPQELYSRHLYTIGSTGSGKTCMFENLIVQDLQNGRGICVIDPHGDFARRILTLIPKKRIKQVVYFNPGDTEYAFRFNLLKLGLPKYETCNALMDSFETIFSEWSYRQLDIMRYCILALLDSESATFRDVSKLLLDIEFRKAVLQSVRDSNVREWWNNFGRFSKDAANPISYKVNMFSTMPMISQVINQPHNCLNIFEILDRGKILIADLPKGELGDEASKLLGTLLVSLIRVGALRRVNTPEKERREFGLYIDEFQSFITPGITSLLEEARKYKIGIHLAHQGFVDSGLPRPLRGAILSNTLTKIVFRCGIKDAEFISSEFPGVRSENLVGLQQYHAYVKMGDQVANIKTLPPPVATDDHAGEIIRRNRREYCYKRPQISDSAPNEDNEEYFTPKYDEI